jgi:hypothetical protein
MVVVLSFNRESDGGFSLVAGLAGGREEKRMFLRV